MTDQAFTQWLTGFAACLNNRHITQDEWKIVLHHLNSVIIRDENTKIDYVLQKNSNSSTTYDLENKEKKLLID